MRKLLIAVAALASAIAVQPPAAGAARGMEVALQDDLLFLHRGAPGAQYFSRDLAFEKMRAIQGSALRVNLIWAHAVADDQVNQQTKPAQVEYDWAAYDALVRLARGYGVKVQFSLTGPAPAWGTESGVVSRGYFRPKIDYYREFVRAVATHFKGRVKRYSIWNEPNWDTWLAPQSEAASIYRDLYRVGYPAIKRADPKANVFFGELVPYDTPHSIAPLKFLRQVTCVDGRYRRKEEAVRRKEGCRKAPLRADGFAHHAYEFKRPPEEPRPTKDDVTIATVGRLTRALDKLENARVLLPRKGPWLPLYLTEFGYFREGARAIGEKKRADWTVRGFKRAVKEPRVKQLLYYVFVQPPGGIFFDLSLLDHTGEETATYRALMRWTVGAAARSDIKRPGPRRGGVTDVNPPPPPGGGGEQPPSGGGGEQPPSGGGGEQPPSGGGGEQPPSGGGGEQPPSGGGEDPPDEPLCPIPLPGLPCPVPPR